MSKEKRSTKEDKEKERSKAKEKAKEKAAKAKKVDSFFNFHFFSFMSLFSHH